MWRHLAKQIHVEARACKERRPRRSCRHRRGILGAGRHRFELHEPARVVEEQLRHANDVHRRVTDGWLPVRSGGHERFGARSVPEQHDRRSPPIEFIPSVRRVARPRDLRDDIEVDGDAGGGVAARGWIAERGQDVARAVVERIERLLHRHARVEEKAIRQGRTRDEPNDDGGDEREADGQMQRFGLAGGRDHVWRRRFASGQRRRQRVAAWQRGGDRKSGWRPFARLRAQAAHHCQFDLGIQRLHHGRRRRDAGLLALLDQLREVLAFERALAREELVEEQPERIDVAARSDLVTSELLWRHVGGRASANRFARRRQRGRSQ